MKIEISDENYAALQTVSNAARISVAEYLEQFCLREAREDYAPNLPRFAADHFGDGQWDYAKEADARAVAALANAANDERLYGVTHSTGAGLKFKVINFLK
ncbi:MAG: hypothetical protein LBK60_00275 [Verrucomicrobiales bacterium]|jgi:hypothetical protein|nr:hypothetical protein [Verrucomicrobiales bacterium]